MPLANTHEVANLLLSIEPAYFLYVTILCVLIVFWLRYTIRNSPEVRAMEALNKRYSATCAFEGNVTIEKRLNSLRAFEHYNARAEAEGYIERNRQYYEAIVERNSRKEQDYAAYQDEYLTIYRQATGLLRYWKRKRIKCLRRPLLSGYEIIIQYSYTSPAGRNHYSKDYTYTWDQIQKYASWLRYPPRKFTPEQFLSKDFRLGDFAGVYVLRNKLTNRCYVGQATSLKTRVKQHFSGRGCADVYVDWRNGAPFEITLHSLEKSYFKSLNEMERYYITKFNAYNGGYNKTHGNF